jgi:hypothetical protein
MDPYELSIVPLYVQESFKHEYLSGSTTGTNVVVQNNIVTMQYSNTSFFEQNKVTDHRILERGSFSFRGSLNLLPQQDLWVDTTFAPDEVITFKANNTFLNVSVGNSSYMGPINSITSNGGSGINSAGYLLLTDTSQGSPVGLGTGTNISYTIANTLNTLQGFSTNSQLNVINTITVVNGGSAWSNASQIRVLTTATAISNATFTVTLGGRAGRITAETLVAQSSLTGHDPRDTPWFPGT